MSPLKMFATIADRIVRTKYQNCKIVNPALRSSSIVILQVMDFKWTYVALVQNMMLSCIWTRRICYCQINVVVVAVDNDDVVVDNDDYLFSI